MAGWPGGGVVVVVFVALNRCAGRVCRSFGCYVALAVEVEVEVEGRGRGSRCCAVWRLEVGVAKARIRWGGDATGSTG